MTDDQTKKKAREELIVGDRAGALDPDEAAELPLLAELLGDPATWAEPSAGLEDAIVRAVADAPSASKRERLPTRAAIVARRRLLLAAAAVVVLAAAASAVVGSLGQAGPDFEGELAATAAAPDATASVDVTANDGGFRITLEAGGLPALQAGEFYQAWLKNSVGTLVPIGTFSSSDERVTLWSGVSPARFSILTVTIEAIDNDQASSGRLVLAGDLHEG
jgi:hypothetical protein